MDSEWTEHHGKGFPDLPLDTIVQVRFDDGWINTEGNKDRVDRWDSCWFHSDPMSRADITHYRVVTP